MFFWAACEQTFWSSESDRDMLYLQELKELFPINSHAPPTSPSVVSASVKVDDRQSEFMHVWKWVKEKRLKAEDQTALKQS